MRVVGTLVGAVAFCVYSRTWQDSWHIIYDIPAALAVYSFIAQILAEGLARQINRWWWIRLVAIIFMTNSTVGRAWAQWPVSGHVTTVLATALIQTTEPRLPHIVRILYWTPLPVLVAIRIGVFDGGFGAPLGWALLTGIAIGGGTVLLGRQQA